MTDVRRIEMGRGFQVASDAWGSADGVAGEASEASTEGVHTHESEVRAILGEDFVETVREGLRGATDPVFARAGDAAPSHVHGAFAEELQAQLRAGFAGWSAVDALGRASITADESIDASADAWVRTAHQRLADPATARAMIESHRDELGVPPGGFDGQVDLEQGGRPRLSSAMARLRPEGAREALDANLERASQIFADPGLLLAVTMREHPSSWTARSLGRIDSYAQGGLDHLGTDIDRMHGLVPESTLRRWVAEDPARGVENGRTHAIRSASIPSRDQLDAYAATLALRERTFESHVREVFGDRADAMLATLSIDARRAWVQATFGRPGRTHYDAEHGRFQRTEAHDGHRGHELPSAYGALERIASEAQRTGTEPTLDAIFTDPMLARYATFQRARTTALEARVIDESGLSTPRPSHEADGGAS